MKVFFIPGADRGALAVKVFIQQQHSYRVILQIFEINVSFFQKIFSQGANRDVFMGSQRPAQLRHDLALY
ncbi:MULTISPECIES: hypothetical protein [Pantoea]|uniref:Uncharacterized protein n=1 Tax=Enterobacter agglomerans TaxID=549 RepID=A0ACC5PSM8_ENTAG|nr:MULTISPECIES: hypothetical protein [Pantoea]AYP24700.1 hypothetical protein D0A61_17905 [Pantoea agglomerans]KAF6682055.1 hypothetical protein HFD94_10810 [Pantoea sp. EKM20T]KNH33293.1 hypothetical protein ACS76_08135 [Pantoea vagans]KYN64040.1 hypothetical protein IU46_002320 [Pantoea agglomerans]MBA8870359.1 hypothetical protein [Pantoea agglomerans]